METSFSDNEVVGKYAGTEKPAAAMAYVIMQNDFPAAVFSDQDAAQQYVDRQPKKDINGRDFFWRVYSFKLNGSAP